MEDFYLKSKLHGAHVTCVALYLVCTGVSSQVSWLENGKRVQLTRGPSSFWPQLQLCARPGSQLPFFTAVAGVSDEPTGFVTGGGTVQL